MFCKTGLSIYLLIDLSFPFSQLLLLPGAVHHCFWGAFALGRAGVERSKAEMPLFTLVSLCK